jgi:hypothetical protein
MQGQEHGLLSQPDSVMLDMGSSAHRFRQRAWFFLLVEKVV